MIKYIVSIILLSSALSSSILAQWVDKLNKLKNIQTTQDALNFVKDETIEQLKKAKEKNYTADLNYAVSFSDNSGLYESKEKFGRVEKTILYTLSPESLSDRSPTEKAQDYNDVGEMMYGSGRFNSALISFVAANIIYINEGMETTRDNSLVLSNIGLLYHTTGRYNLAREYSEKALEIRKKLGDDKNGLSASYNNLGVLYKDMGKYTEAGDYIENALQVVMESGDKKSTSYAIVLNNKAILYQQTGKYSEAEKMLHEAISQASEELKEKSPNFVRMKINLALLYQLQHKYQEAENIYLEAISIKKRRLGTNHPDYAVLLRNLASLYMLTGQYDKVEQNLIEAKKIFFDKFGENNPSYAATLYDLGKYYLFMNQLSEARETLSRAELIQNDVLGDHHPAYTDTREAMAILNWQEGDYNKAFDMYTLVLDEYLYQVNAYFPAMSDYDKSKFWEKIHPKFIRFFSFASSVSNQIPGITGKIYDYHIATKALLLNDANKVKEGILNSGNQELINHYNEWLDFKEYLARCYTLTKEELREDKINIDSLEIAANTKEKELSRLSVHFAASRENKSVSYNDIARKLKTSEACIEIIRFDNYQGLKSDTTVSYIALVLKNNNQPPSMVLFREGNRMETWYAGKYRSDMQNAVENEEYFDVYWNRLQDETGSISNIFISPDGIFNQVNINTLKNKTGKYIINEKNIHYITNSREITEKKDARKLSASVNEAVLVGNPFFARDIDWDKLKSMPLQELPGTETEITKIGTELKSKNWKTRVFKYENATEENVKMVERPAVFHVATHGFFLEDAPSGEEKIFGIEPLRAAGNPLLRSGLMFAGADNTIQHIGSIDSEKKDDGILNAYEAMLLDLENTELVILSACETGLGETRNGEGVYGLQRAFMIAGASAIIISLWEVSDEVTQELMTTFYKRWLAGADKHVAFKEAQLHVKAKHPEPFYWGAFILAGW